MDTNNEFEEIITGCIKGRIGFRHRVMDFGQPVVNEVMKTLKETFNEENYDEIHQSGLNAVFSDLNEVARNSVYDFFEIIVFENDKYNGVLFKYTNQSNNVIELTPKSICINILKNDPGLVKLFFQ